MFKYIFSAILLFGYFKVESKSLYSISFGNNTNPAIIYLHGGPGYNCSNFEVTTVQKLADNGFYVIVYDRRGEGRSIAEKAKYTFEESFADLKSLYNEYSITQATLIGHSFGGIIATLFAEQYPTKVKTIVLVGAPISLQESFITILNTCKKIYTDKNDEVSLNYINQIEQLDVESLEYSSACFYHAMKNGFYTPKVFTEDAKKQYALFKTDTILLQHASVMTIEATKGFWRNEAYTSINLTEKMKQLLLNKIPIVGMYGKDDGLYSAQQINELSKLIGFENLKYFDNCSHNVFIDQQPAFLEAITKWIKLH